MSDPRTCLWCDGSLAAHVPYEYWLFHIHPYCAIEQAARWGRLC